MSQAAMAEPHESNQGANMRRIAAQILVYAAFAVFIGYFSVSPTYTQVPRFRRQWG